MTIDVKFFNTEEELTKLTGWSHDQLWENGFNLDDWDWGIAIDTIHAKEFEENQWLILSAMSNYCCGYEKVRTPLRTYYLLYHS